MIENFFDSVTPVVYPEMEPNMLGLRKRLVISQFLRQMALKTVNDHPECHDTDSFFAHIYTGFLPTVEKNKSKL